MYLGWCTERFEQGKELPHFRVGECADVLVEDGVFFG